MKTVTAVLLGAGSRGRYIYGPYAEKHPDELKIVAVAEPNEERRQRIAEIHGIAPEYVYRSWEQAFEKGRIADVMIISTLDRLHYVPAMKALELSYHILLEKPMSPVAEECIRIEQAALAHRRVLTVSHVLRYSPFWSGIKRCIEAGEVGTIATIQHSEYVGYRHMTHSYVRGNWRNSDQSSPMVLAKSCHDLDIISWLMDEPCVSVSSYGSLLHFREEHAPAGSAARCTDGCQAERSCPFSALKLYNQPPEHPWARYITHDLSPEGIMTALKEGPFGRCVYRCDNNVVDHQIVNMEFANGANANFTLSAFAEQEIRSVRIMGTKGEIIGNMEDGTYTLKRFATGERVEFHCGVAGDGHGGGDERMVAEFLHLVREHQEEAMATALTSATASLQSHLIAFAAEESRLQGGMPVKLADMIGRVAAEAGV
ncbi:Gfo/Idh/MocA family oxidoreductase [Paenibacillus thiaminolyticus]|uniref:Gfo/Idh/MocA family oxidoreductase n=1 Tax=Paenibacillus thiaminolyticus TaxID=49283 RepID=A0AAP9DX86_PANTH|nr:Gfo/Idh/MocA family oxidoreductase [Paenibacillus thiaminolyticus]MCY9533822.1 Gfo/Idh/MocA family oxidoreductase [Paenibacillus thiaminolyticus]MCY9604373.1 Gfo/Idh/MocA family oxidoreductase [Paenibacillus thiaminolyticus]MCY9609831.1 Gfo/Idh/MocA family oxidoreductase [Paenibacillus thiaminolyticus]MCY9613775.1 Gfo/Idh/MocA family oxidoreductase [Paenibacillus thiaminolyticus]MCY9620677.1 Gfo/Idh/MocA family oxidoreductase [Paenibacillus thiaminolyticus]